TGSRRAWHERSFRGSGRRSAVGALSGASCPGSRHETVACLRRRVSLATRDDRRGSHPEAVTFVPAWSRASVVREPPPTWGRRPAAVAAEEGLNEANATRFRPSTLAR